MIRKRFKYLTCLVVLLITLSSLAGCGSTTTSSASSAKTASSDLFTRLVNYSSEDMDTRWDAASATKIILQGSSAVIDGSGASAANSTVTITAAGTYVLSGALTDGQVIVSASEKDKVHLVLNGVTLSCSDSAPLSIKQADKTLVTLAAGTTNRVSDGTKYKIASGDDEPDAAIFSQSDLTLNGTGALTVNGNYKNGIGTKDDLVVTGGNITVTAAKDGVQGRDSVAIKEGTLTIQAKNDGIQSNNDQDTKKGWISLDGGTLNIKADQDGIQAETILQINGGKLNLTTGGGSANASNKKGADFPGSRMSNTTSNAEDTASAKALKAGTGIGISNGVLTIDSADDALHTNGYAAIKGGTFTISAGDDALHADSHLTIDAGTITIAKSYEGLEGAYITLNGGNIHLTASDDGINAANASTSSDSQQQDGGNPNSVQDCEVRITGGNIYIDAAGDGIDSNGNLTIAGGTIIVNGPTNNGNGPLDYNGTSKITGGILVAAGSSGMAQAPEDTSSQNSLLVYYSSVQKAGTLVNLSDTAGNSILTFAPSKDYQSIVISMPELQQGKTYTLSSGGTCSGTSVNGRYTGGTYTSGTKLTAVKLSSALTRISDDGSAVTGQNAMGVGPGGGQPPNGSQPGKRPGM